MPQVKEGTWDFRALVVNDRLCPRARLPQTGRLTHETSFPVRWMSSAGGGWERKPTRQDLTTLQYKAGLDVAMRNLKTLGRRRGYDPASETFLVVPGQEARGFRIGPTDYVLTRELTNAQDLFAEWAAQRHTMPTETISSVLGVTARR